MDAHDVDRSLRQTESRLAWCLVAVDFFNQISIMYSILGEFCTTESCPIMSAGPRYEYHWADGETVKKPIRVSASEYVELLMNWVQRKLEDDRIFPSKIGMPPPPPTSRQARWLG